MRYFPLLFLFLLAACSGGAKKQTVHQQVTGNWFVIYPEEELKSKEQEDLYAKLQDSLINLKGVKLVTFADNGTFIQWDSTILRGKWGTVDETQVVVSKAGKGFENFKATFSGLEEDILKLTEYVNADGEVLKLVWHLKKISTGKTADLFAPEKNFWRTAAATTETEDELKKRLSAMLSYYAIYFKLISDASSYFMPVRVMLPIRFYQHAIGMKDFDETHRFVSLFSSAGQAKKAFDILKATVNETEFDLPDEKKNSYSFEYSLMLEKLATEVLK